MARVSLSLSLLTHEQILMNISEHVDNKTRCKLLHFGECSTFLWDIISIIPPLRSLAGY